MPSSYLRNLITHSNVIVRYGVMTFSAQNKKHPLYKDNTYFFCVKTEFDGEETMVNIRRRGRPSVRFVDLITLLWPEGKPIMAEKLKDINIMMHLIPADAIRLYTNFTSLPATTIDEVNGFMGN